MRRTSALYFAVAVFLLLLSLPGIPEQIRAFAELLGMSGAEWNWWNYVGVSLALILMFYSLHPLWQRLVRFIGGGGVKLNFSMVRNMMTVQLAIALIAAPIIVGGIIHLLTREWPSYVWVHPTLSAEKQKRAKANCRMKAYKVIGGGTGKMLDRTEDHWRSYVADCLTSKGFERIQEKADR